MNWYMPFLVTNLPRIVFQLVELRFKLTFDELAVDYETRNGSKGTLFSDKLIR